jgi:hypothetical protein
MIKTLRKVMMSMNKKMKYQALSILESNIMNFVNFDGVLYSDVPAVHDLESNQSYPLELWIGVIQAKLNDLPKSRGVRVSTGVCMFLMKQAITIKSDIVQYLTGQTSKKPKIMPKQLVDMDSEEGFRICLEISVTKHVSKQSAIYRKLVNKGCEVPPSFVDYLKLQHEASNITGPEREEFSLQRKLARKLAKGIDSIPLAYARGRQPVDHMLNPADASHPF